MNERGVIMEYKEKSLEKVNWDAELLFSISKDKDTHWSEKQQIENK